MNIILFYHSLLSDWNHGNAHFLRGYATELEARGNVVNIYEPENNWSITNLIADNGRSAIQEFTWYYPTLKSRTYDPRKPDLDSILKDADLVILHEWNEHSLVKASGEKKKKHGYKLLFHDTHHRAVTDKAGIKAYDLKYYDGVLAFGEVIRDIYINQGWTKSAWTWHEAADTRIFKPLAESDVEGDIVWIGNWGDNERAKELSDFLIEPVRELKLKAKVYGVRYPAHARKALANAGIEYCGWLPNYKAPEVFSRFRFTVHVPRKPYTKALPGIPTIRPFEAMACGIPLISAPWDDVEGLFNTGRDYVVANTKTEMIKQIERLLSNNGGVSEQTGHALNTIEQRHTCRHRIDELYNICEQIDVKNFTSQTISV